jgi:hypothetical protein
MIFALFQFILKAQSMSKLGRQIHLEALHFNDIGVWPVFLISSVGIQPNLIRINFKDTKQTNYSPITNDL